MSTRYPLVIHRPSGDIIAVDGTYSLGTAQFFLAENGHDCELTIEKHGFQRVIAAHPTGTLAEGLIAHEDDDAHDGGDDSDESPCRLLLVRPSGDRVEIEGLYSIDTAEAFCAANGHDVSRFTLEDDGRTIVAHSSQPEPEPLPETETEPE